MIIYGGRKVTRLGWVSRCIAGDFDPTATAEVAGQTYTHGELKRALDAHADITLAPHPFALARAGVQYYHRPSGERRPLVEMAQWLLADWDDAGELALLLDLERRETTPSWGVIAQID